MNELAYFGARTRQRMAIKACGLALVLGAWAVSGHAAQSSGSFSVVVNLQMSPLVIPPGPAPANAPPNTGTCEVIGAFGISAKVACSVGGVRFVTQPPLAGVRTGILRDTGTDFERIGTVTSWQTIHGEYGDYLEMTVRW